jgi:hypothetical protein
VWGFNLSPAPLADRVLELDPVMLELDRIAERWYGKKAKRT